MGTRWEAESERGVVSQAQQLSHSLGGGDTPGSWKDTGRPWGACLSHGETWVSCSSGGCLAGRWVGTQDTDFLGTLIHMRQAWSRRRGKQMGT